VTVCQWPEDDVSIDPHEAVIEAFGCHLPGGFVRRMAARQPSPVWINLEYLSAEAYVERNHGLPSPQPAGPTEALRKWFFYPGFTASTGGLLREPDLARRQAEFDAHAWLSGQGIVTAPGERLVSVFCYANAALPALIDALADAPTRLLATTGHAARQVRAVLGPSLARGALRAHCLPALSQADFDCLLWSCDLNLVRGEDSFVRAQWAGRPFLWQIYPQEDRAHVAKLAAFTRRFLAVASPALAAAITRATDQWNAVDEAPRATESPGRFALPPAALWPEWTAHCEAWRDHLCALPDLAAALRAFVEEHR
jgi:uncharacterized repeat protein (TIGR03837 family)